MMWGKLDSYIQRKKLDHYIIHYTKKLTENGLKDFKTLGEEPRWWRNRTGRPLSPLQIH